MLHYGACGLILGLLFVFLDSPSSQMCSDSSCWTMGTASLLPSRGPSWQNCYSEDVYCRGRRD